ncbi:Wzz/FepE/Etk N-terminal domain-containing protein [Marinitenerispora sediminis]|uniref:Chain length determinant family protein n=1 Tax=Marinitenerispora sediminis TaxID=1931232 RepID=A0A368T3W9_9ACTN|nr:Wzz/FepE/Etk N-terminal domain-containing protein [Marinitenerispora sediminis]RCV56022.1 chain length determinant family protein [Marinitenerispora sediminis]RCV57743.1 chain length determinant family protein [Marinitenerispora sediminis]RCV60990.1 chain length determinant family protein [Marinitenerispora sediminis]
MDTAASGPELGDYTAFLRRRWWIVAVGAAVGVTLAALALLVVPATYTAKTAVQVRPTGVPDLTGERSGRTNGEVNLDTEAQVVASTQVAYAAVSLMDSAEEVTEARERVSVTVPPNSSVLEIAFSDATPELARRGSAAFAAAYLDYRRAQVTDQLDGRIAALRDEREGRRAELDALAERAATSSGGARVRAESHLAAVQGELTELNNQINPLSALRESVVPGRIITAATAPDSPSSPVALLWLTGGALLGLLGGLTAGYVVDRSAPRLHRVRELRGSVGAPLLLDLTDEAEAVSAAGGPLPSAGRAAQGFHALAHTLRNRLGVTGRLLLVPAVPPGRSGGIAAVNLAAALARTDADVLLVCADLEDRTAAELLDVTDGPGLAEVLEGAAEHTEVERRPAGVPGLRVLPPGRPGEHTAELLQRDVMSVLLHELRGSARYVLIATAPTSVRADAYAMADDADAAIVTVELGRTRVSDAVDAVQRLERLGVEVLGTVGLPERRPAEVPVPEAAPAEHAGQRSAGAAIRTARDLFERLRVWWGLPPSSAAATPAGVTAAQPTEDRPAGAEQAEKADRTGTSEPAAPAAPPEPAEEDRTEQAVPEAEPAAPGPEAPAAPAAADGPVVKKSAVPAQQAGTAADDADLAPQR